MSIIAIDPGTTNTGLVWMDGQRFIDAKTIRFDSPVKDDQLALMRRAEAITREFFGWAGQIPCNVIVMEGFVNYRGMQSQYTYQTPYLCGYLHRAMRGAVIVIQTSRQVLNPHTRGNCAWVKDALAKGQDTGWGNARIITNDHTRSAAAHGIYYYRHKEEK